MRPVGGCVVLALGLALGPAPARAQDPGASLKDQVWARALADAAGVGPALARRLAVEAPPGEGVAVDLAGLSARRLRFRSPEEALAWARRGVERGRGLVLVEVRERQAVALRGAALEDADRAARIRAAAWDVLRAPEAAPALLAASRDGEAAATGPAAEGAPPGSPALAGWLAQLERAAAAPRRAPVSVTRRLRPGEVLRRALEPIPGGFWYAAVAAPEGSDLDLRLSAGEDRWQARTPASCEEVLAPADRPLVAAARHGGGAPCDAQLVAIPVAAAEPLSEGKPVAATFDRQVLPMQVHGLTPAAAFTRVRLAPRGPGGDLDLVLCDAALRPVAAARGPTADERLVVPPGAGEADRRWLIVRAGRAERPGQPRAAPAPYALVREPIPLAGTLAPGAPLAGRLDDGQEAWWARLRSPSSGILCVRLRAAAPGDLDLTVIGPGGETRSATALDASEEVAVDVRSETDYLVRVARGARPAPAGGFTVELEPLALDRLAADSRDGPRVWTVVIGVASYERAVDDLSFTRGDALTVYGELRRRAVPGLPGVEPSRAIVLLDDRATAANVRRALEALAARADADDTVILFFSGHGVSDLPDGGRGDPVDEADGRDEAICTHEAAGRIDDDALRALLDAIPARRQVVILDACHSGGFAEVVRGRPGRAGIFSSLETQTSAESRRLEAGLLTALLVLGLAGPADADGDAQVTVAELGRFVGRELPRRCVACLTEVAPGDRECPGCDLDLGRAGARQAPVVVTEGLGEEVVLGATDAGLGAGGGR